MIPSCDHTGTSHFHSSTTPGSACLISARTFASAAPRQPPSSLIRASISRAASFGLDVGDFRLLAIRLQLRLDEFLELGGRTRRGEGAGVCDALEHALVVLRLAHFGGELLDDLHRRTRWREHAEPA